MNDTLIHLYNGDAIRADTIYAIRIAKANKKNSICKYIRPRVIIDFGFNVGPFSGGVNSTTCYFNTLSEATEYKEQLGVEIRTALALLLAIDTPKAKEQRDTLLAACNNALDQLRLSCDTKAMATLDEAIKAVPVG